uniref:G protein-coupled receptor n=1 Tax=Romanomermis culicivorax TaxID=13658 RepID=A0A915K7C5_ROMCU
SCAPVFNEIPTWRLLLFCYGPINLAYTVSIFCAYKTSRFISRNSQSPLLTEYQIDEAKSIIIFIFFEISIPTILQTPIALMSFFPQFMKSHFSDQLLTLAITLYPAHATTDPILSVLVVKPYRVRFLSWVKKRFFKSVAPDQEMRDV